MEIMEHAVIGDVDAEVRLLVHLGDGHTLVYNFDRSSDVYNQAVQFFLADLESRL